MQILKPFLIALVAFIVCDAVWFILVANNFYKKAIGGLMRLGPDGAFAPSWTPIIFVYIFIALGLVVFVLPKIIGGGFGSAFGFGALFGFLVYGIYELTNLAFLANWPLSIVIVDTLWGALASGIVALVLKYFS